MFTVRVPSVGTRGWVGRAVISGLVATVAMTLALVVGYLAALAFAELAPSTGLVRAEEGRDLIRWAHGLTANHLVDFSQNAPYLALAIHATVGIGWALVYAALAQPRLLGAEWERGMQFSLLPWLLSLVVFFPLTGAGFLGLDLGAGPLPIAGNLVLHVVYGIVLGATYGPAGDVEVSGTAETDEAASSWGWENAGALGMIGGALIGGVAGAVLPLGQPAWLTLTLPGAPGLANVLAAATLGGALGLLAGSWLGLTTGGEQPDSVRAAGRQRS